MRDADSPMSRLEELRAVMHRIGMLYGLSHPLTIRVSEAVDREINRETTMRHYAANDGVEGKNEKRPKAGYYYWSPGTDHRRAATQEGMGGHHSSTGSSERLGGVIADGEPVNRYR